MSAVLAPQPLAVEERIGNQSTEYRITGSLAEVLIAIAYRFSAHHPLGYGTRVAEIICISDGIYSARMTRSNSCE